MSVFAYSYETAAENFTKGQFSRWHQKDARLRNKVLMSERLGGTFYPGVHCTERIDRSDSIFTIGSCFARGLERAAHRAGMKALSLRTQRFLGKEITSGYVNRYNTSSILNELRWASGTPFPDDYFVEKSPGHYIDPHSHPVVGAAPMESIRNLRNGLRDYFAQALTANVITITLGLIEGWFDKQTGQMLNINPVYGRDDGSGRKLIHGDRFEFRVMSHDENMSNLEDIYALIRRSNPSAKIFVSVSPVPLSATFSHRDVAVANMLSKSMLRSCAETWIGKHPDIQYFPSYEMAMLSDRAVVFQEDTIHIQQPFVDAIMQHFMDNCVTAPEQSPSSCAPNEPLSR